MSGAIGLTKDALEWASNPSMQAYIAKLNLILSLLLDTARKSKQQDLLMQRCLLDPQTRAGRAHCFDDGLHIGDHDQFWLKSLQLAVVVFYLDSFDSPPVRLTDCLAGETENIQPTHLQISSALLASPVILPTVFATNRQAGGAITSRPSIRDSKIFCS